MNTLLLNDTSWYHCGCKEVIHTLTSYYNPTAVCDTRDDIELSNLDAYDLVVLNGEGTLHHNAPWARKFLGYIREAQRMGKYTHIVNTVWQAMGSEWTSVITQAQHVEVREILSQTEMYTTTGRNPSVVLDAALHSIVPHRPMELVDVYVGGSFYGDLQVDWNTYTHIDIFTESWDTLVNKLRHARLLITGRHHEMYAALQARIPVITVPGNTWKNEGFFHTMGCAELLLPPTQDYITDTLNGKYDSIWNTIWDRLNTLELKYGRQH